MFGLLDVWMFECLDAWMWTNQSPRYKQSTINHNTSAVLEREPSWNGFEGDLVSVLPSSMAAAFSITQWDFCPTDGQVVWMIDRVLDWVIDWD
jgi:hypothetical protein